MACHRISQPHIGPAMVAIADRYAGERAGLATIRRSLQFGGSGKWGMNEMPPQVHLAKATRGELAEWILHIRKSPHLEQWTEREKIELTNNPPNLFDQTINQKIRLPEKREGLIVQAIDQPIIYRTYLPGATSRAIAVGLPGDVSYAFDATECRLLYFWKGGFLDFKRSWAGYGGWYSKLIGKKFFKASTNFPLRFERMKSPEVRFLGYRTDGELPTFNYQVNGVSVGQTIGYQSKNRTIVLSFQIPDAEGPIYFDSGESTAIWSSGDAANQEGVWKVHHGKRKHFSFRAQVK